MWDWFFNNKEWFFSGIGIVILSAIYKIFFYKDGKETIKQTQKTGRGCINIQLNNSGNKKK